MKDKPRSQRERTSATRAALIRAARTQFAADGYATVSTEAIVHAAGVTRGALYHQFADKRALFAAVFETVEAEVTARIDKAVSDSAVTDVVELMRLGAATWLDVCAEPEVQRIALIDGPAVLGWQAWREVGMRYGIGLVQGLLATAVASGAIAAQPVEALAHVLIGALDEAALFIALADDPARARREVGAVLDRLVQSLAVY